jgi:hypothetical protein
MQDTASRLIDTAVKYGPALTPTHQTPEVELVRQLANFFLDKPCRVFAARVEVRLARGDEADEAVDTVVRPDIAVVCDETKIDRRGCRGAPDWVLVFAKGLVDR